MVYTSVPPVLTVLQVGRLLGVSQATAYRIFHENLPKANIRGRYRVPTADFEALIGRAITAEEFIRIAGPGPARHAIPSTQIAPDMDTASKITEPRHGQSTNVAA